MNTILSVWCDFCTHAHALALMALVPVLLYTWHTETVVGYPAAPVRRSPKKGVRSTDTPHRDSGKGPRNVRTLRPAAMTGIRNSETPRLASVHIQESVNSDAGELEGWAA